MPLDAPETSSEIERAMAEEGIETEKGTRSDGGIIYMSACACHEVDRVLNLAAEHQFVDEPPSVFLGGWGYFRLITFEEENLRPLFRELNSLGATELLGRRAVSLDMLPGSVWISSLFPELTDRQKDAVLRAHQYGYYVSPRRVTTDSIAKTMGVSRSTFEDHLRKGENRIIATIIPYLRLFTGRRRRKRSLSSVQ